MNGFEHIKPEMVTDNYIRLIGKDWMLITAGNQECFNTMTASWGGVGFLWNKPVVLPLSVLNAIRMGLWRREKSLRSLFSMKNIVKRCRCAAPCPVGR